MAEEAPPTILPAAIASEDAPTQVSASSPGHAEEPKIFVPTAMKRSADETVESEPEEMAPVQDDDERLPPRKKARRHLADEVKSADDSTESVDEGEVDSEGISKENTLSQVDGQDSSPEPTTANNAPSGLRTSFATSVPKQLNPDMAMHTAIAPEERVQLIDGLRNAESKTVKPIKKRDVWWTNPPIRADAVVCSSWLKAYESALDTWCGEFIAENRQTIDETGLSPDILKTAFMRRLDDAVVSIPPDFRKTAKRQLRDPDSSRLQNFAAEFKPDPKKDAKRKARKEAKEAKKAAQGQQAFLPEPAAIAQEPLPTGADTNAELEEGERMETDTEMDNEMSGAGQAISQEELGLRQRYYPGVPSGAPFCIACTSMGHPTAKCPEAKCKFCQEEHFTYQCPSRQRCEKCKQLGHTKSSCKEKLAVAPGEGFMECAFCQGQDHEEVDCTDLWQTYRPKMGFTKKVKQLPIYCYCCGAQGHFGSDCGLADPKVPPSETWTTAYASLYLDSDSSELPIVDQNPPPPPPEESKPIIPGRSIKPQSHIIFEESDDEGQDFIRAPTGAAKSAKSIQIKSNISFGGASASTAPPPPPPQQQLPRRPVRPAAQKALAIINAPPPPPRQGTRRYPLRSGKQASKRGQQHNQQQPPLPSGPPPSNGGTSNKGGRGRGGFSNLGRRGRGRSSSNR